MFPSGTKMHKLLEFPGKTWWVVCFKISSRKWFFLMSKRKEKIISWLEKQLLCIMILLILWVMLGPVVVKMTTISQKLLRANAGMNSAFFSMCAFMCHPQGQGRDKELTQILFGRICPLTDTPAPSPEALRHGTDYTESINVRSATGQKFKCFQRRNLWEP